MSENREEYQLHNNKHRMEWKLKQKTYIYIWLNKIIIFFFCLFKIMWLKKKKKNCVLDFNLFCFFVVYHWPITIVRFPLQPLNYVLDTNNFRYDLVLSFQSLECYYNGQLVWWICVVMRRWYDYPYAMLLLMVNHLWLRNM